MLIERFSLQKAISDSWNYRRHCICDSFQATTHFLGSSVLKYTKIVNRYKCRWLYAHKSILAAGRSKFEEFFGGLRCWEKLHKANYNQQLYYWNSSYWSKALTRIACGSTTVTFVIKPRNRIKYAEMVLRSYDVKDPDSVELERLHRLDLKCKETVVFVLAWTEWERNPMASDWLNELDDEERLHRSTVKDFYFPRSNRRTSFIP